MYFWENRFSFKIRSGFSANKIYFTIIWRRIRGENVFEYLIFTLQLSNKILILIGGKGKTQPANLLLVGYQVVWQFLSEILVDTKSKPNRVLRFYCKKIPYFSNYISGTFIHGIFFVVVHFQVGCQSHFEYFLRIVWNATDFSFSATISRLSVTAFDLISK